MPIHTANLNAIKSLGRSDIFLKTDIIKKIFGLSLLMISIPFGVLTIAISLLISNFISLIINSLPNGKIINYGFIQQMKDISPSLIMSIIMYIFVIQIKLIHLNMFLELIIQMLFGIIIYIFFSKITNNEAYCYLRHKAGTILANNFIIHKIL